MISQSRNALLMSRANALDASLFTPSVCFFELRWAINRLVYNAGVYADQWADPHARVTIDQPVVQFDAYMEDMIFLWTVLLVRSSRRVS